MYYHYLIVSAIEIYIVMHYNISVLCVDSMRAMVEICQLDRNHRQNGGMIIMLDAVIASVIGGLIVLAIQYTAHEIIRRVKR